MTDREPIDFAALFDEVAKRYGRSRDEAARALIDYANLRKTSSGQPYVVQRNGGLESVGNFRVHFNSHNYAPLVWSILLMVEVEGVPAPAWEISAQEVSIDTACTTVYDGKRDDGQPSAWIAVSGRLTVDERGHARIGSA